MRPAEITAEQIFAAGQELQAAGRSITGFGLRQRIGGGNPSRLKQVWDEYVSGQSVINPDPVAELPIEVAEEMASVSKALVDRLTVLAVQLNDKAVKAAERRVAEVVRTAGEQREQAHRELFDASQTVEDLEGKLDEAVGSLALLESRLSDTQTRYQSQGVELARVRERLSMVEQAFEASGEKYAAEIARLNAVIDGERQRYQQQVDQARVDQQQVQKALEDVCSERGQLLIELSAVKARAEASELIYQEQRLRLAQVESELNISRSDVVKANADAALLLAGKIDSLVEQNSSFMSFLKVSDPSLSSPDFAQAISGGVQAKSVRGPRKSHDV